VQVLHEYKDGQRNNAIMKGMDATLSDQDIEDIAAYFSSLPTKLDTLQGHIQGDKQVRVDCKKRPACGPFFWISAIESGDRGLAFGLL
jgi:hypothetical protein